MTALAETYVGPGVRFPPIDDPPPGHVIRIVVDRVDGFGPWASSDRTEESPS
jgi:hypothetical protein